MFLGALIDFIQEGWTRGIIKVSCCNNEGGNHVQRPQTESINPDGLALEDRTDAEALAALLDGQLAAVSAVRPAIPDLARAARAMEEAIRGGGRLVYAGAGSSALMAVADGLELPGTFGIAPEQVVLCMAGGFPVDGLLPADVEDDADLARRDAAAAGVGEGDVVIAVTASGATPYTVAFAEAARAAGARTICMASNPDAPIFAQASIAICLATPPELVAGSTRLGAGTAQKVALNLVSTLMGLRLGHVHAGMMVNLRAENAKLRARATAIVSCIAGVTEAQAAQHLEASGGEVKLAILRAAGAGDDAVDLLERHGGRLGPALKELHAGPVGE
jgi:N-acetylmuramic acid 6-phosphate etherase